MGSDEVVIREGASEDDEQVALEVHNAVAQTGLPLSKAPVFLLVSDPRPTVDR